MQSPRTLLRIQAFQVMINTRKDTATSYNVDVKGAIYSEVRIFSVL